MGENTQTMKEKLRLLGQRFLSVETRRKIVRYASWPPVGWVRFGSLRRVTPFNRDWGYSRGQPLDRYYIEQFLSSVSDDIQGRVLEIKENSYTVQFGGSRVTKSDVLHKIASNPKATLVADLSADNDLPDDTFDCIICTQTLQFIYDVKAALTTLHRILKPGGVLLVTVPTIAQISRVDMELWGDYWRFTSLATRLLFEEVFPPANVTVQAYGNVLTTTAFLYGLVSEDLKPGELDYVDPDHEFLIAVRAVKCGDPT
jgi:SAM-dependent methyltransferase